MSDYQAINLTLQEDGQVLPQYVGKNLPTLKNNDVLIRVQYSSINHKDALTLNAKSGVVRNYPIVPGIDFAGMVIESDDPAFFVGDKVVGTGFEFGVKRDGGYSEFVLAPGHKIFKIPRPLTMRDTMILGTAGLTAAICLSHFLQLKASTNKDIPILVTGVTGGVGGLILAMLRKLGFTNLTAVTRRTDVNGYLTDLGATKIIDPQKLKNSRHKPLLKGEYAAVLDSVGGQLLGDILGRLEYNGCAITCGNTAGNNFGASVLPFILRGIKLIGVDSVDYPAPDRQELWQLLASSFRLDSEHSVAVHEISFEDMLPTLKDFSEHPQMGRTIIAFP
ncbi:acryloyl-CoA reductase [Agrilactobacillus yilanensis]|uniref:Acryloyl-CoA reductase n=1 Tax=Agrilactobacillus yilanensis TaxID=2485997 RepID=A0ABW4JA44_9LACO|nr:acryloyl-CoA reductase [Agrilactobacillus yilanensis]